MEDLTNSFNSIDLAPQPITQDDYLEAFLLRDATFRQLHYLMEKGWNAPGGDRHFRVQRARADNADSIDQRYLYRMMKDVGAEVQEHTQAFSLPIVEPKALDVCLAPGGFAAVVLKENPGCQVEGFSLPQELGGHTVRLGLGKKNPGVRIVFLDVTMFAKEMEVLREMRILSVIDDHPDREKLQQEWPFETAGYDLVICDGQVLRTHRRLDYREQSEPSRLTNAQLYLGLKKVKVGGTMIVLLHRPFSVQIFLLLYAFQQFSDIQLYKPKRAFKERSSFYFVAKNIRSNSQEAAAAMEGFRTLWKRATFPEKAVPEGPEENDDVDDIRAKVDEFGTTFLELARPVWEVQIGALETATWMNSFVLQRHPFGVAAETQYLL